MKSEVFFLLETAGWPALVVEAGGTIRQANQAALAFFGPILQAGGANLSAIWAEEGENVDQFLARWERSATSPLPLKFRGQGAAVITFSTHLSSSRVGQQRFLFQLWRETVSTPTLSGPSPEEKSSAGESPLLAKQKLECALQLTRTVSLDFNNALTGILGHASFLLGTMAPDHPSRPALLEIEKAASKAAEIAHQLAVFSRPEKEAQELAAGNLNALLRRAVEILQQSRPSTAVWSLQLESRIYAVRFDEAKMQQAFVKILENALEAVPLEGRISVTSRNLDISEPTHDRSTQLLPGSYVCLEFTDDGAGIEPEVLPRIFEPFFTTKRAHRGLGLAWVYGIVTNHSGGVAVSSQPGKGTSVRVYLPATKKIVRESLESDLHLGGEQTVLMVDDEDLLLTMGRTILSAFGYRVFTAGNGAAALDLLQRAEPPIDLVIADLVMPQMSGRELIEQIRARFPSMPILCTSGFVRSYAPEEELILQKPFTSQELLLRVKQALQASRTT